ncbi:MAG TPA: hypothetical protein VKZ98_05450 [Aquaticitalea sp.]|nr:hypothetical protein [Aquaticitalea sp.]
MKKIFLLLTIFYCVSVNAQDSYTVNGETLQLKTEVDGNVDLLWNIIDNEYRYFIRTSDNSITELVNTRNDNDKYQEEYKTTLGKATGMSADKVNLTLPSLISFIESHNKTQDANFVSTHSKSKAQLRLMVFGGITNSPFVKNPENVKTPVFGAELEVSEGRENPRHSGFFQVRHVLEDADEFPYSTTELSLGYRFRFIRSTGFNIFADVKAATVNFAKGNIATIDGEEVTISEGSDTAFDVPFIFGLGADIRISDTSFITVGYNQLFALFLDDQDNFSTDITLGYKLKL